MSNEMMVGFNSGLQATGISEVTESAKAIQEVQAALVIAQKFPRNELGAYNNILNACKRLKLAESSMYEYARGGAKITGPSIRLAEMLSQYWGNMDTGWKELERSNGKSKVIAYAWDLQTNTKHSLTFEVAHKRDTKGGSKILTDERDIYEMIANYASRRKRACILATIPSDIVESAVEACKKTLSGGYKEPLIDRIRKMVNVFQEKWSVSVEMLEKYIGCSAEAFSENDFIRLRNVYTSLKDGMSSREDYFEIELKQVASNKEVENVFAGEPKEEKTSSKKTKEEVAEIISGVSNVEIKSEDGEDDTEQ